MGPAFFIAIYFAFTFSPISNQRIMSKFQDYDFAGKKAIIRVDFNVPLDERYNITDDTRIKATMPTIKKIVKDGGSVILMSHLGRPNGKPNAKYSLRPVAEEVSRLLGQKVSFLNNCVGPEVEVAAANATGGSFFYFCYYEIN